MDKEEWEGKENGRGEACGGTRECACTMYVEEEEEAGERGRGGWSRQRGTMMSAHQARSTCKCTWRGEGK